VSKRVDIVSLLCLGGAMLLWGTSFAAMKTALVGFPPMTVIWIRMALGSLIFLPFWPRLPKPERRPGDWKWLLLLGLFEPCLYFLLEGYAINLTTSSQAGMISAIVPLLVAAGAALFLKERLPALAVAGLAISVGGVVALSLAGAPAEHAPAPALGNMLELLAMVSAAGYMLVAKRMSSRYDPWILTGLQSVMGAVFFLPALLTTDPAVWLAAPRSAWIAALYLGCFVTLGGVGLYNVAVSRMPASRAAMAINLIPLVAVAAGWLVLDEALTPVQGLACIAIVGGVMLGEFASPEIALVTAEPPQQVTVPEATADEPSDPRKRP
jgi:drug/metabolite transporter (DMT)-like permease